MKLRHVGSLFEIFVACETMAVPFHTFVVKTLHKRSDNKINSDTFPV